jgi:DNA polymerase III alpha subunit
MLKNKKEQIIKKFDEDNNELTIRFGLGSIKAVGVGAMKNLVNVKNEEGEFKDIYDFAAKLGSKILNKKSVEALSKAGALDKIHHNRRQIHDSCELICKYANFKEEEKNSNQMSLFDSNLGIKIKNPTLKNVENWNSKEKLQKEFEAFGFFPGDHPLDGDIIELKKRGIILSDMLSRPVIGDNSIINMAGIVTYSKHRSGSKGRFAYLNLCDPYGIYETSIFDEDLITKSRDLMESGSSLVISCLVRKDDGGIRLLVKKITNLEEFIKNNKAKKEEFLDIKLQPKKDFSKFNDKKNIEDDILFLQNIKKQKLAKLELKEVIEEVNITINQREAIFNLKSFLFQKVAPEEIKKTSKVIIFSDNNKIELPDGYILDKKDCESINAISGLKVNNS